jgi:hypothetical protein
MARRIRYKPKWRTRYVKAPRRRRSGGKRLFGGKLGGVLPWAAGIAGLLVASKFQPFGGRYKPVVDSVATGAVLSAVGLDNMDLVTAGAKWGIATAINDYLLPKTSVGGGL